MTAIAVHRDGWVAADQLSTIGPTKGPFIVHKILDFGHTLIAAAGVAAFKQRFVDEVRPSQTKTAKLLKKALVQYIRETQPDIEVVLVNTDGDISKFDSEGCEFPLMDGHDYITIGSGGSEVAGWLGACNHKNGKVTAADAVNAIQYAASMVITVNAEVDIAHLSNQMRPSKASKRKSSTSSKSRALKKSRARK